MTTINNTLPSGKNTIWTPDDKTFYNSADPNRGSVNVKDFPPGKMGDFITSICKLVGEEYNGKENATTLKAKTCHEKYWKDRQAARNNNASIVYKEVTAEATQHKDVVLQAVDYIESQYDFATIEETGEIRYYENGVYVPGGEALIDRLAQAEFREEMTLNRLREIKGHIRRETSHKLAEFDKDVHIINVQNGLYNWKEDRNDDHDPKYLSLKQTPFPYVKGAKPKMFGKFLSEVLYPNEIRTAVELMAYTFYRANPFEMYTILYGTGGNGKSVFTDVLTALHSDQNVSNVPLNDILHNTFAKADLENKNVNVDTELSSGLITDMAVLRKLTGKQPTKIERKHQKSYDTRLFVKLWFNANRLMFSEDEADADFRRRIVISFPNQFDGSKADVNLQDKLTNKEELSGIFNVLMSALRRIMKNSAVYVNQKTIAERREKSELLRDPIGRFVKDYVEFDFESESALPKEDLHTEYKTWCKKHDLPIEQYDTFCRILKNKHNFPDDRETSGTRRRVWTGIRLKQLASLAA